MTESALEDVEEDDDPDGETRVGGRATKMSASAEVRITACHGVSWCDEVHLGVCGTAWHGLSRRLSRCDERSPSAEARRRRSLETAPRRSGLVRWRFVVTAPPTRRRRSSSSRAALAPSHCHLRGVSGISSRTPPRGCFGCFCRPPPLSLLRCRRRSTSTGARRRDWSAGG